MKQVLEIIDQQEWLDKISDSVQPAILDGFKKSGDAGKKFKNLLHGNWLGHPVHPMITDIPLGAWTTAAVLDSIELCGSKKFKQGADAAIVIGLAGAAGSAITGITDWTGTTSIERKTGLLHGMLNLGATALYATSFALRKNKSSRKTAIALSMLGYGITAIAAYLGGTLVYNKQMGVNHTAIPLGYPKKFTAVLPAKELKVNKPTCVHADKVDVLLFKKGRKIYAIANTCSHLGGPLSEGKITNDCKVICPWHESVFSLKDGGVIEGPATAPQPAFDVRVRKGQIEIKLRSGWVE